VQFYKAVVIDHIKYAVTKLGCDHSLIAADNLIDSPVILGSEGIKVGLKTFDRCRHVLTRRQVCLGFIADDFDISIKVSSASGLKKRFACYGILYYLEFYSSYLLPLFSGSC